MVNNLTKDTFFDRDGAAIVVARREPQPFFPRHRHQFSELVIVTSGTGTHSIRNEEYPVSTGDIFVITDNSAHEYTNMKELGLINILYDADDLDMGSWNVRMLPGYHALFTLEPAYRRRHNFESRLRIDIDTLSKITDMVRQLEVELEHRRPGYRLMTAGLFMQIVCTLSRNYEQSSKPASLELLRIGEAISYMEENWRDAIPLETLANIADMSRRNFTRVFRSALGRSPNDYLIHLRITRAAALLRNTDVKVTEAAFRSGFDDSNYFARQFRKITGLSPTKYRKTRSV